uniref:Uncharacterized protein n=1 Tax=Arundo donax TaxID=35708 RepID=A0A0A9DZF9_ARUDO
MPQSEFDCLSKTKHEFDSVSEIRTDELHGTSGGRKTGSPRERFGSVLEVTRTWRHKKPGSDSFDIGTEAGAPTAAGSGGGIWSMH